MFVTHGPVPPESPLFVGRAIELKRMERWLTDANCYGALLGARQTGKTSLLLKLRHAFLDKYAFAFVDLQGVEGAQPRECFRYIAEQMLEQLAETIDGEEPHLPKANRTFTTFLRELSRRARAVRIIVMLDEIGAVPLETTVKLASTIRAVFIDRMVKPELARYVFLLAGATDMMELTTGRNSPLGNVTDKIYLGDLSLDETGQLLAKQFTCAGLGSFARINRRLHNWTGGHPYWTQLLAGNLASQAQVPTERTIRAVVEQLLRTEDRNLPHIIRLLKADGGLWDLVESLLNGVPLRFSRANAAIAKLELIGILKDQDGRCAIRNRIYQEAIHRYQITPVRLPAANLRILSQLTLTAADQSSMLREGTAFLQQVFQSRTLVMFEKKPRNPNFQVSAGVGVGEKLCGELMFAPGSPLLEMLTKGAEPSISDLPGAEQVQLARISTALLVPLRLKDELVGFLSLGEKLSGENYDAQDREFLTAAAGQLATGIERMSLQELKLDEERARDIQRDLLPREIPQVVGLQISGDWRPARLVSGDYYDVLKFDERRMAFCIGDVVGKGIPAALLMSSLQAAVKAFASACTPPVDLCQQVNRLISKSIAPGKFITFFYGLVDGEVRRLTYTNAGHNPPILVRYDGTVVRLDEGGALLGVFPDWKYLQGQLDLTSGDRLLLFTDGVSEAQDSEEHQFGEERLIELVKESRHLDAANLLRKVIETVAEFSRGNFHDDVTLVGVTVL